MALDTDCYADCRKQAMMLSVIMLNGVMLRVIMVSVVAPFYEANYESIKLTNFRLNLIIHCVS
jgi:hypothetical protein